MIPRKKIVVFFAIAVAVLAATAVLREDFDVLIQLRAALPVIRHAAEISEIDRW
jgi:hypothetical protein